MFKRVLNSNWEYHSHETKHMFNAGMNKVVWVTYKHKHLPIFKIKEEVV